MSNIEESTKLINIRIPKSLYQGAKEVFDQNYISFSTGIKMYLAEVKRTGHIPVDTQINKKESD